MCNVKTKEAIMTIGVSCSGKTTWAREYVEHMKTHGQNWKIVCRDDIREVIYVRNKRQPFEWSKWKWKWEKEVTEKQTEMITSHALDQNVDGIIIADTNLSPKTRRQLTDLLTKNNFYVTEKVFSISFFDACQRDAARQNGVGFHVIAQQYENWNEQYGLRGEYVATPNLPKAVIVDVDGTVAQMIDRGPFEWHKVSSDRPREHVIDIVKGLHLQGYHVIFMSGRSAECFKETQQWLQNYVGCFFSLFMRDVDDNRDDRLVKKDLFDRHVKDWFNVQIVLDDRPKVCRLWQDMGLNVLWVANPYKEF